MRLHTVVEQKERAHNAQLRMRRLYGGRCRIAYCRERSFSFRRARRRIPLESDISSVEESVFFEGEVIHPYRAKIRLGQRAGGGI